MQIAAATLACKSEYADEIHENARYNASPAFGAGNCSSNPKSA